jgi:hypothetical protein
MRLFTPEKNGQLNTISVYTSKSYRGGVETRMIVTTVEAFLRAVVFANNLYTEPVRLQTLCAPFLINTSSAKFEMTIEVCRPFEKPRMRT